MKVLNIYIQIYLFKIKMTPYNKENSSIICGKLVNLIIKSKPEYMNFSDNG